MIDSEKKTALRSRPTIQSLDRGLTLLEYVVSAAKAVPLGELADLLGIERSSTHRLMATLLKHGYVIQDVHKMYLPGPAILELASKVGNRRGVHELAKRYLADLAEKTGEASHLGILGRGYVVLTDCVSSNHALAVTSRVGQNEPIYCTALGKALVCQMDEKQLKRILGDGPLKPYCEGTITSLRELMAECERVRKDLVAVDDEEYRAGIRCLASPVRDFTGQVVAAIGISGPKERLKDDVFRRYAEYVKKAGVELSCQLGFCEK